MDCHPASIRFRMRPWPAGAGAIFASIALALALPDCSAAQEHPPAPAAASPAPAPAARLWGLEWHLLVEASNTYNFNRPASGANSYRVFDVEHKSWRFDLAELSVLRAAEPLGFQVDLVGGKDVPLMASYGTRNTDLVDFRQAFLSWKPGTSGFEVRAGKFVTTCGYESIPDWSNQNPNFSNSFLFGYAIPYTHTGVRLIFPFSPTFTLLAGANRGWDKWKDNNDAPSYELSATWTPGPASSFIVSTHHGPEQSGNKDDWRHLYDFVATFKASAATSVGFNIDYASESGASLVHPGRNAKWYGAAGYLIMTFDPKWNASLRLEYFNDRDGSRTGVSQELTETDLTVDWKLSDDLMIRFDGRVDQSSELIFPKQDQKRERLVKNQPTFGLAFVFHL